MVTGTRPRAHPAPYLPHTLIPGGSRPLRAAVPPYISGRTSYLRVRLAFHPYPQVLPQFCNTGGCVPRRGLTPASHCPWIAHPVSGRIRVTPRPLQTRFRSGSVALPRLNLPATPLPWPATQMHSSDHSTKGTPSARIGPERPTQPPPTARRYRVSGSLSSPSRGAFHPSLTVLVRYRWPRVFSLGGWSPPLPAGFLVPRGTRARGAAPASSSPTGLSPAPAWRPSHFG